MYTQETTLGYPGAALSKAIPTYICINTKAPLLGYPSEVPLRAIYMYPHRNLFSGSIVKLCKLYVIPSDISCCSSAAS
jgi:hypothetical protein